MRIYFFAYCCLFIFLSFSCSDEGRRAKGRSCTSSASCSHGETCVDQVCVRTPDAGILDSHDTGTENRDIDSGLSSEVEICGNGRDDNGNGVIDEQCSCGGEATQACYGGHPEHAGVGVCSLGTQHCESAGEFGSWGDCIEWGSPTDESCDDGLDNDCDGTADEGCGCPPGETRSCYTGPPHTEGVGNCIPGIQRCTESEWDECLDSVLPERERCDGQDNDCDREVDEGCSCTPSSTMNCFETPSGMPSRGTPGVGECKEGMRTCISLPSGGSEFGACEGATPARAEVCRNGADEDCDSIIDEGCDRPPTVDCSVADVLFLVDVTGSMSSAIRQIQSRLRDTIIPGLAAEIRDVRFSVASFADFPFSIYGTYRDAPFTLLQEITSDIHQTQGAVDRLSASGGGDEPESHVEALYQVATGEGLGRWIAERSCSEGRGYPCFRHGATPIILLFTDAPFHNGPGGAYPYSGISPAPHSYTETVNALNALNAKVIGLLTGSAAAYDDLQSIARDTRTLASDDSPIVFDIGSDGASLGEDIVRAVQTLCR